MGELIVLEEYRRRKEEEEIAELRAELQRIINENDLHVVIEPYYDYNILEQMALTPFFFTTPIDFYTWR